VSDQEGEKQKDVPSVGISIRSRGGAEFFTSDSNVKELSLIVLFFMKLGPASSSNTSPAETRQK